MSDVLPMADGSTIPAPAGLTDLGMGSVAAAVDTIRRAGGFSGPVAAGVLLGFEPAWSGGGQFPPHWDLWLGGAYAMGFTQVGTAVVAGLNDFAPGQWVLCLTTGHVVTLLGRLVDVGTFQAAR